MSEEEKILKSRPKRGHRRGETAGQAEKAAPPLSVLLARVEAETKFSQTHSQGSSKSRMSQSPKSSEFSQAGLAAQQIIHEKLVKKKRSDRSNASQKSDRRKTYYAAHGGERVKRTVNSSNASSNINKIKPGSLDDSKRTYNDCTILKSS